MLAYFGLEQVAEEKLLCVENGLFTYLNIGN